MMDRLALAGCREPQLWTTYVKGLRPQLRARVLSSHPSTIHSAQASALENEQLLKLEHQETMHKGALNMLEPDTKPQWIDPFLKEVKKTMSKMVGSIQQPEPADTNPPPRPPRYQAQDIPPYCTYCRIPGHTYAECRNKMRAVICWNCSEAGHFKSA